MALDLVIGAGLVLSFFAVRYSFGDRLKGVGGAGSASVLSLCGILPKLDLRVTAAAGDVANAELAPAILILVTW